MKGFIGKTHNMKCPALLVLLTSVISAPAAWKVSDSAELGTLRGGGLVRRAELAANGTSAQLTAITFQSKTYSLRVVDSKSPGRTKLDASLQAAGCIAGVNGGYFHDNFRPVGLMIENGVEIQPFEKAKLLAGILALRGKQWEIVRSSAFKNSPDVRQAIQCGPMLVESGQPTVGLNANRTADDCGDGRARTMGVNLPHIRHAGGRCRNSCDPRSPRKLEADNSVEPGRRILQRPLGSHHAC